MQQKRWSTWLTTCASTAAVLSLGIPSGAVLAGEQAGAVEEVIVTGSYIRGTPEDAALPVDVIDRRELLSRGNPDALDLIRAMPYTGPIMGETNQFGPNQGTIGVGNVNLRGLGGMRTLVLMNGRRTTYTPAEGPTGVDTNLLPIAAIGRLEVLKDGAAATYGSDAIAGVVNFITRRDLEGLELSGEYRSIEDNDGDYNGSINWGWVGDDSNVLISYAQQFRAELRTTDRDWAFPPYLVNPTGWSGLSMPGTFVPRAADNSPLAGGTKDANCTALGGFEDPSVCRFSFMPFDNLVEETERQQLYGELNTEIAPGVEFHIEGLWAETILPNYRTSPGYPPISGIAGPGSGQFYVFSDPDGPTPFSNNPGALLALQQSGLAQGIIDATDRIQLASWRPHGWGGVPSLTGGNGGQINRNTYDMARASASLKGTFESGWTEGIGWDVAVTYSDSEHTRSGVDNMITRLQDALNGLGGPDCNGIAYGQPGSTCLFYNPFSNSIARNPALGLTNPGFNPAYANSPEVLDWMIERWDVIQDQSLLVADLVFDGQFGWFELPGGNVGWAVGGQYRKIDYQTRVNNPLTDAQVNPCPIPGDNTCPSQVGPFIFLGQFIPQELDDSVYAAFGELAIPILESLQAQIAVRYEDYGGLTGDTTDPKLSLRWQAMDWLALRGSVGSTFRGPTPVNRALRATGLQPIPQVGFQYRAIDNFGEPALQPEKADTMSFGVIVDIGGFRGIVDYWSYEFKDPITTLPYPAITASVLGAGTGTQLVNCGSPFRDLVTFDNNNTCTQGVTTAAQMQRVRVNVVNGPDIDTSGLDISLSYAFDELWGGELRVGVDATYVDEYDVDPFLYNGLVLQAPFSAAGYANQERGVGTISEWRALGYANYGYGPINARYELRFVQGVTDDRASPTVLDATGAPVVVTFGKHIDSYYAHNLYLNWEAPWDLNVSFSVVNLLDEDPPDARHQLSYDPYIGDPLGRTFEIGLRKTFFGR
jgi:iron complex outermembrane receptor protein